MIRKLFWIYFINFRLLDEKKLTTNENPQIITNEYYSSKLSGFKSNLDNFNKNPPAMIESASLGSLYKNQNKSKKIKNDLLIKIINIYFQIINIKLQ